MTIFVGTSCNLDFTEYISDSSVNVLPWVSGTIRIAMIDTTEQIPLCIQNSADIPMALAQAGKTFKTAVIITNLEI